MSPNHDPNHDGESRGSTLNVANAPLSSVTVGEAISSLASAMGITEQRIKKDDLREPILADENYL
jgi:hypothetical protein